MCRSRTVRHTMRHALSFSLAVAGATAQHPPLAPTATTTIVVSTGVLQYSSIQIPAGVAVRFVVAGGGQQNPGMPAVVLCDGDAIVHGTLSVAGEAINVYPAGWVFTGLGTFGEECTSSFPGASSYRPPGGGRHAGEYGTVVPFSLEGGSPGGVLFRYVDLGPLPCGQALGYTPGRPCGGTLALVAGGRIEIGGTVTADGYHSGPPGSGGSGGSILLRGHAGVTVLPGGTVTALGGTHAQAPLVTFGAPGYVRLDTWGALPDIQGTVAPAPTLVELPHLRVVAPPQIGTTCLLHVFSPQFTTRTWLVGSLRAGPGTMTPFGVLGVDLATAVGIGVASTPLPPPYQHDPRAALLWPIPNAPALVGLPLWIQGFTFSSSLPARFTNTAAVVVR